MTNPCKGIMIRTSVVKTHDSLQFPAWHMTKRHERIKRKKDWDTTTKRMMGWGCKWRSEKKRGKEREATTKTLYFFRWQHKKTEQQKKRWKRSAKCSFEDAVSTKKTRLRSSFKVKCLFLCLCLCLSLPQESSWWRERTWSPCFSFPSSFTVTREEDG